MHSHLGGFVGYSEEKVSTVVSRRRATAPTFRERDVHLEEATLPYRLVLARDAALPVLQVENTLLRPRGPRKKAERVVSSPLLPGTISTQTSAVLLC